LKGTHSNRGYGGFIEVMHPIEKGFFTLFFEEDKDKVIIKGKWFIEDVGFFIK